jgi:hypothetical protein
MPILKQGPCQLRDSRGKQVDIAVQHFKTKPTKWDSPPTGGGIYHQRHGWKDEW